MARKRRNRQEAYDESLRNWESRERRKLRDYKYKEEREERKKLERVSIVTRYSDPVSYTHLTLPTTPYV